MNLHGLVVTAVFLPQEVSSGNLILFRLLRLMRLLRLVKLLQVLRRFRRKDGTNPGVFGTIPVGQELVAYGARTSRVCEHLELGHLDATCPALTNIPEAPFCPARIPIVLLPRLRHWFLGIENLVFL
jgi:hypothetical protein